MAAKVFSTPDGLDVPEFDDFRDGHGYDTDAYFKACDEHRVKVADWCKANSDSARLHGNIVGKTISFGVADGRAEYMIYRHSPLSLIHLDYSDGYMADEILLRGLNLTDCKRLARSAENLRSIFGGKS